MSTRAETERAAYRRYLKGQGFAPNHEDGGLFDDAFGSQEELGRGVGADVEQKLGMPEMLDASRLLKSTKGLSEPAVFWFKRRDAWMVKTTAADERAALKIGKAVQRSLISKRRLKSVDPYLHQAELYAAFDGGHVVLPGLADIKSSAGPSSAGIIKQKVLFKAKEFFGARGAKLSGKAGAYRLWLAPARAELKGLFAAGTLTAATLQELDHKLDLTISEVSEMAGEGFAPNAPRRSPKRKKSVAKQEAFVSIGRAQHATSGWDVAIWKKYKRGWTQGTLMNVGENDSPEWYAKRFFDMLKRDGHPVSFRYDDAWAREAKLRFPQRD